MVAQYRSRLDEPDGPAFRASIRADRAPSAHERAAMEARRSELLAGLRPEPCPEETRVIVLSLLTAFPAYGTDQPEAQALAEAHRTALADLPTWAIREAAGRFLQGRAIEGWNGRNCPAPPQLAREARRSLDGVHGELVRLSRVLDARVEAPVTANERARVLGEIRRGPSGSARDAGGAAGMSA